MNLRVVFLYELSLAHLKPNAIVEQIFPPLTWRIRHLTMYPEKPYDFVKLENDFDGIHFGIYVDYELTGVVSLFIDGETAQFRKLAILPAAQHRGLGSQLLQELMAFCRIQNIKLLWCNARESAKTFYTNMDFTSSGIAFEKNQMLYLKMEITL